MEYNTKLREHYDLTKEEDEVLSEIESYADENDIDLNDTFTETELMETIRSEQPYERFDTVIALYEGQKRRKRIALMNWLPEQADNN